MNCRKAQQKIMPYIERKLSDSELEEFLDHVKECPDCSEELEVYFTVYYALRKLDEDDTDSFDMKELLKRDMEKQRALQQKKESRSFVRKFSCVLAGMLLAVLILTGVQALFRGGITGTTIYQWIAPETTEAVATEEVSGTEIQEEREPETNHKRQVILMIPETEKVTEPGPIPENPEVQQAAT